MNETLELLAAIGSILTPILVLVLSGIGWVISKRLEQAHELEKYYRDREEKLQQDRIKAYNTILEPFIILLTPDRAFQDSKKTAKSKHEVAGAKMTSLEYRHAAFQLALAGSDGVVRAYNKLMQYFYTRTETSPADAKETSPADAKEMMNLLGSFLLSIRKGIGNDKTTLSEIEMLEWLLRDLYTDTP